MIVRVLLTALSLPAWSVATAEIVFSPLSRSSEVEKRPSALATISSKSPLILRLTVVPASALPSIVSLVLLVNSTLESSLGGAGGVLSRMLMGLLLVPERLITLAKREAKPKPKKMTMRTKLTVRTP